MVKPRPRLFLIDAMSNIFRAYYAIRGLSNRSGTPTNAVYGFTAMLRKLIVDEKPEYLAAVFDTAEPTFRHEMYVEYKANRAEMPDDLGPQIPLVYGICDALRVPTLRKPGYEADDILGTLARRAVAAGMAVSIISNDKDLCQLVNDHVVVIKSDRQNTVVCDAKGVEDRLGVPPHLVVDYLALVGDSSDNVPGAPGIGEKGGVQIIRQFGSLEKALEGWAEVGRKSYRESLRDHRDLILKSKKLVTIHTDVPLEVDLESLRYQGPDLEATVQLLKELDFTTLLKDLVGIDALLRAPQPDKPEDRPHSQKLQGPAELNRWVEEALKEPVVALAWSSATGGITEVGLSVRDGESVSCRLDGEAPLADSLEPLLSSAHPRKLALDWKPIWKLCRRHELGLSGTLEDLSLASWLLDPNSGKYGLEDLSKAWLDAPVNPDDPARAAETLGRIAPLLLEQLKKAELDRPYRELEIPVVEVLADMELAGVRIDAVVLAEVAGEMEAEIGRLTRMIHKEAGRPFNINSPQQLAQIFEELGIEVTRRTRKTGRVATGADVLEEIAGKFPLAQMVLDYREVVKLKGTYVDSLPTLIDPRTRRIHTTYDQTGTATGRLSSRNPNLQNIPIRSELGRRIRRAFVPAPGHLFISADYSQIDLRVLAHVSEDPVMTEAFRRGADIHTQVARSVFGAQTPAEEKEFRRQAKIVNFAIAYGIGAFGLSQRVGLPRKEAQRVIDAYYKLYAGVRAYMDRIPEEARRLGYVSTLGGRRRPIPQIADRNFNNRARAEREAINAPIQGGAADIFKMAMLRVHHALRRESLRTRMVLQVHDEIVLEAPEQEAEVVRRLVKTEMEAAYPLRVPLVVDAASGRNWMEAKGD
ncbi:MAG: DNA polymerase I [Acidobacteria bacterium]|nr:DNA polymerase I [Acidobacteriota bacterium]